MFNSKRRWIIAILVASYLYFLLPATAVVFYELYHLTGIDPIYWGYSGFKAAGYYFGAYPHKMLVCLMVALLIVTVPVIFQRVRTGEGVK